MEAYQTVKTYCQNCGHVLFRGPLKFGPGIVGCKKCQKEISLNLTNWQDLSFSEKIGNIIKEFFLPSFFLPNRDNFTRGFLHFFFTLTTTLFATPITMLFDKSLQSSVFVNILVGIFTFWYPFFVLIPRIIRIRKQSIMYKNILPKW